MSDEVKSKVFVDIVKDFVKKMQTTIDTEDGTSGLYRYISDLLKELEGTIAEDLPTFKEKSQKYYETIKVEVDAKNIEKGAKEIPTKIDEFGKEYNSWREKCLEDIDSIHDEKSFNILQGAMQASGGNANKETQEAYQLAKANRDMSMKSKTYFEQNEYLIMLNKHTDSPNEPLTDKCAAAAETCRKLIEEIKQMYKDFMIEYIKLSSDHIIDNDNKASQEAFNDDNTLDLDRFYQEGLGLLEEELDYVDEENGFIRIPFGSVTAKVFKDQNKITVVDGENEKELSISDAKNFSIVDKLKLYFALYIEQYKESIRINKNIEIFNTLISYKNNPQSLQYKIDVIKETYNNIDLDDGQTVESFVNCKWEEIFTKSKEAGYWKEISDDDMESFSNYLKQAVLDISKGLLDDMAPKYQKMKFTKNSSTSFFKKRSGYYIVDLDCLEPLTNGSKLVTREKLNEMAIMEKIDGADKSDNPFYIENIKSSIVNGAWNGKYPIIIKMIKSIKDTNFQKIMKNTFVN